MRKLATVVLGVFALLVLSSATARADTISIASTGVDGGDADAFDDNYLLTSAPGVGTTGATLLTTRPSAWYNSTGWIGVNDANGCYAPGCAVDPIGTYSFDLAVDLTGYDAFSAAISGFWAADNSGQIFLNNVLASSIANPAYASLTAFNLTSGFVAGLNTISFRVTNVACPECGSNGNPMGLLVTGISGTASPVPEPASLLLLGTGLTYLARRRMTRRS